MSHNPGPAILLTIVCTLAAAAFVASCRRPSAGGAHATQAPGRATKANARCYECHVDFEGEDLASVHEKAGVACVRCHGHSQPHIDDEVRATKADATFRGKAMKVFCLTCHRPAAYRGRPAHAANEALAPDKQRSCTRCHGEHELVDSSG